MKKIKCFSKCRQLPEDSCKEKTRLCQFTKGNRKYCRISKFYKLDKNCNMIKKTKKVTKAEASLKIKKFLLNKTRKHKEQKIKEHQKKAASKKISKFMIKTGNKRKAHFLKTICFDSGACLTFGTEINNINKFFNYFVNFEYAVSPIKKIGAVSANGFVTEIKYSREGYDAYAVLKSSIEPDSDNLMYEYEVGLFINKQNKIFPCFLQTYGLFYYKDEASWKQVKGINIAGVKLIENSLEVIPIDYSIGCTKSKYLAVLIQHIQKPVSLYDFLSNVLKEPDDIEQTTLINFDLLYILYQIYMPLATLKDVFTHYDLHLNNVLIYEPGYDEYITYHYHLNDGTIVKFHSKYIVKIIDYGRAYFKDGTHNSKKVYDNICKITECDPNCGEDVGFSILGPEIPPGSFSYVSSQVKNESADLFLINSLVQIFLYHKNTFSKFNSILNKIWFKGKHGTKEVRTSGLPHRINNVSDVCESLQEIITEPSHILQNERDFAYYDPLGDFHIYQDGRPMNFIKA